MPDRREIEGLRPARNRVDPFVPYHYLHEQEIDQWGSVQEVNTVFLTSKECAFSCTMCDLWKNTLREPTPIGAIPAQIDYALSRLPGGHTLKLYNSGNFFDPKAIPPADYPQIARRVQSYKRLIVENHPLLAGSLCLEFSKLYPGTLEIAMGLESIHPQVLPRLNKKLTKAEFKKAASFLRSEGMELRAFILLNPPYLTEEDANREWTLRSIEFAFESGVSACSIIPTRPGNGIMDLLQRKGDYVPPTLESLEWVLEQGLALKRGRVFVDTWDIGFMSHCPKCTSQRINRLAQINLTQKIQEKISCECYEQLR